MVAFDIDLGFRCCAGLAGAAHLVALYEHRRLRAHLVPGSAWAWDVVRDTHRNAPPLVRTVCGWEARYPNIFASLGVAASLWVMFHPALLPLGLLLGGVLVMSHRWAGALGGGSDSMMVQILAALCVGAWWDTPASKSAALYFIAVQSLLSYTLAGLAKLRTREWRRGTALSSFAASHAIRALPGSGPLHLIACVAVLVFECTAAVAVVDARTAVAWVGVAIAFHCVNTIVFGLHRFGWVWLATYPAVVFTASVVGNL